MATATQQRPDAQHQQQQPQQGTSHTSHAQGQPPGGSNQPHQPQMPTVTHTHPGAPGGVGGGGGGVGVVGTAGANGEVEMSWEGDKMFNIYVYDYCNKRGYRKTAAELLLEARLPPEPRPPIDAKQGLLFEWWSVFWELFQAKSNGHGSDDAKLYVQHQSAQAQRLGPMPHQQLRFPNGVVPPGAQMPGQPPTQGVVRPGMSVGVGMHQPGQPGQQPPPMQPIPMTNGIVQGSSQGQGQNQSQANAGPGPGGGAPPGTPGATGQPNGVHASAGATGVGGPQSNQAPGQTQPGQAQQQQPPMSGGTRPLGSTPLTATGAVGAGQRPGGGGGASEGVSGSTGGATGAAGGAGGPPSFQSPTMGHPSAGPQGQNQAQGGQPGQPPQPGQPGQPPPMGMWGQPSHMMGMGMPPHAMPPMGVMMRGVPMMLPNGYPGHPGQHPHGMHPPPPGHAAPMSMMHPHMGPHQGQPGQPGQQQGGQPGQPGQPGHQVGPPNAQRAGAAAADSPRYGAGSRAATPAQQQQGGASNAGASGSGGPGPNVTGPGGMHQSPSLANRQVGQGQAGQSHVGTPPSFSGTRGPQGRGAKRNSVSPGDETDVQPKAEASSPGRKRPRRSPASDTPQTNAAAGPGPGSSSNTSGPAPLPPPGQNAPTQQPPSQNASPSPRFNPQPPMMQNGVRMPNGMPFPQPGTPGQPGMTGMSPAQQMTTQLQHMHRNQPPMHGAPMHKMEPPFGAQGAQGFMGQPGPNSNRPGASKPMGMMPPPSPITNGVPKGVVQSSPQQQSASGSVKQEGSSNAPTPGRTDASPRSQPTSAPPSATGGPGTPVPAPSSVGAPSPSPLMSNTNTGNTSRPATATATPQSNVPAAQPQQPPLSQSALSGLSSDSLGGMDPFMQTEFGDLSSIFSTSEMSFEGDFQAFFGYDAGDSLDLK